MVKIRKCASVLFICLGFFAWFRFSFDILDRIEIVANGVAIKCNNDVVSEGIGNKTYFSRRPLHTKAKSLDITVSFQERERLIAEHLIETPQYQSVSVSPTHLFLLRSPPAATR